LSSDGAKQLKVICSNKLKLIELDVTNEQHVENASNYVKDNLNNKGKLKAY